MGTSGWWLATAALPGGPSAVPSLPQFVDAFLRASEQLLRPSGETLRAALAGLAIAVPAGVALAVALTAFQVTRRAVLPVMTWLSAREALSAPRVGPILTMAAVPLLILWLGPGREPAVVLIVLVCLVPIVVSAVVGLTSTPAELIELTQSLSASWWQTFAKIQFPWALPQIFAGLKLAVPLALAGAVITEISHRESGLGAVIATSGASLDPALGYAAVMLSITMGAMLVFLVLMAERLLVRWPVRRDRPVGR